MQKFKLGQLVVTMGIDNLTNAYPEFSEFVSASLQRYVKCDWGDLVPEDKTQNDESVKNNDSRIMAAYNHPFHEDWRIWIITEWDRSVTTVLFPSEY